MVCQILSVGRQTECWGCSTPSRTPRFGYAPVTGARFTYSFCHGTAPVGVFKKSSKVSLFPSHIFTIVIAYFWSYYESVWYDDLCVSLYICSPCSWQYRRVPMSSRSFRWRSNLDWLHEVAKRQNTLIILRNRSETDFNQWFQSVNKYEKQASMIILISEAN